MQVKGNPTGVAFEHLIDALIDMSDSVQWMIRPDVPRDDAVMDILHTFHPHLLGAQELYEWNDVVVTSGKAAIAYIYEATPELGTELKTLATSLYDFRQPALPEDLVFYREEGKNELFRMNSERQTATFSNVTEEERLIIEPLLQHLQ